MSVTIGSLFSGIGGLELGLEWAGLGPVATRGLLPTLTRRDEKGPGPTHTKAGQDLPQSLGVRLSADWCRWFMGFPGGWLDVDDAAVSLPSATRSSRNARKSSGK